MFLCSQCLLTTLIGAVRSHRGTLLSYSFSLSPTRRELYVFAMEVKNFGFFISGIVPIRSCFESCPNFPILKSVTEHLCSSCCHFFRMPGSIGGSNVNSSYLFLGVKGCYIPVPFVTSLKYMEYKVNSETLSQIHRIQVLFSALEEFPVSDLVFGLHSRQ